MENSFEKIFEEAVNSITGKADSKVITGAPIETKNGVVIIPVSKVSIGFIGGGTQFAAKNSEKNNAGNGGGIGMNSIPVGFLVISADGNVKYISTSNDNNSITLDQLGEQIGDIVGKIKEAVSKKKKESEDEAAKEETKHE
ncbi:MAG: sporulation protein YtfJ [Clostridiales bacterium]|nr:sporulation protein YtfJ [Clostridiales bacterium]